MANLKLRPYDISPSISAPFCLHLWPITDISWISSDATGIFILVSSMTIGKTLCLCRVNIRPFLFVQEDIYSYNLGKLSQTVTSVSPSEINPHTATNSFFPRWMKPSYWNIWQDPSPHPSKVSSDLRRVREETRVSGWTRDTYHKESNLEVPAFLYKLDSLLCENTLYF